MPKAERSELCRLLDWPQRSVLRLLAQENYPHKTAGRYRDQLGLVEEFIVEIEGAPKNCDVTRWGRFTDIKDIKREMLKRLEAHFEKWLNP